MPRKKETDPVLRAKHAADARKGGLARVAKQRARRRAAFEARAAELAAHPEVDDAIKPPADLDAEQLDLSGKSIPRPSADLRDYAADGEAARQLSWHRHWAAQRSLLDFKLRRGELLTAEEVGERDYDWDQALLARLGTLPALLESSAAIPTERERWRKLGERWVSETRAALAEHASRCPQPRATPVPQTSADAPP